MPPGPIPSSEIEQIEPIADPEALYLVLLIQAPFHRFTSAPCRYGLRRYGRTTHDVVAASFDRDALLAWAAEHGHKVSIL